MADECVLVASSASLSLSFHIHYTFVVSPSMVSFNYLVCL